MRSPDELALLAMCARCKARPGERCVTVTGRPTAGSHGPRLQVVFEAQAEQYAEDVHFMQPDSRWHHHDSCAWCTREAHEAAARESR